MTTRDDRELAFQALGELLEKLGNAFIADTIPRTPHVAFWGYALAYFNNYGSVEEQSVLAAGYSAAQSINNPDAVRAACAEARLADSPVRDPFVHAVQNSKSGLRDRPRKVIIGYALQGAEKWLEDLPGDTTHTDGRGNPPRK